MPLVPMPVLLDHAAENCKAPMITFGQAGHAGNVEPAALEQIARRCAA